MDIARLLFIFLIFNLCGCAMFSHYEQLMTLKHLGDNQKETAKYVESQDKLFEQLLDDMKNDKIKPHMLKNDIITLYGEPVFYKDVAENTSVKEMLLYRKSTEYFSSDKVYMYFNGEGELLYWEYEPYKRTETEPAEKLN